MDETLADSTERAKQLIINNSLPSDTQIDVPTCFNGSWSTRVWVARKGVVAAITGNIFQVIDIIFKSNYYRYCETLIEKRKSGKIDELQYLSLYIKDTHRKKHPKIKLQRLQKIRI